MCSLGYLPCFIYKYIIPLLQKFVNYFLIIFKKFFKFFWWRKCETFRETRGRAERETIVKQNVEQYFCGQNGSPRSWASRSNTANYSCTSAGRQQTNTLKVGVGLWENQKLRWEFGLLSTFHSSNLFSILKHDNLFSIPQHESLNSQTRSPHAKQKFF